MQDSVSQSPFDVNQIHPLTLPSVSLEERGQLPLVSGIYFAMTQAGDVLYIGKAVSIRRRWEAHHKLEEIQSHPGVKIAWLPCIAAEDELAALERACITHFKPPLNYNPVPSGLMKATYYITPEQDMKLEQLRMKRRIKGEKVDKSALIREAIDLLSE